MFTTMHSGGVNESEASKCFVSSVNTPSSSLTGSTKQSLQASPRWPSMSTTSDRTCLTSNPKLWQWPTALSIWPNHRAPTLSRTPSVPRPPRSSSRERSGIILLPGSLKTNALTSSARINCVHRESTSPMKATMRYVT